MELDINPIHANVQLCYGVHINLENIPFSQGQGMLTSLDWWSTRNEVTGLDAKVLLAHLPQEDASDNQAHFVKDSGYHHVWLQSRICKYDK